MDFQKKLNSILSSNNKLKLILVLGFLGIFLIAISSFNFKKKDEKNEPSKSCSSNFNLSLEDYSAQLEKRIKKMVSQIEGAGRCDVTITMERGIENVYANSEKKVQNQGENFSGKVTTQDNVQRDVVVIDSNNGKRALMITQKEPTVKGVVVVCEGANNSRISANVTDAVTKALNISPNKLSVVKGIFTSKKI